MIIDLRRFASTEQPYWEELDALVGRIERDPAMDLTLDVARRLLYLYQRCASSLTRLRTNNAEPATIRYLEGLVSRAYAEIYETRGKDTGLMPWRWLAVTFPATFRRHIGAFALSLALTLLGSAFGAFALAIDNESKSALMPFAGLNQNPRDRVRQEELQKADSPAGQHGSFSASLMTHNTRVAFFTAALGVTWGVGTTVSLFYNGVVLGAVAFDYVRAGETTFLLGWLLPHGVVEIPAILIGGQAGFLLASALIGWGKRNTRGERLRMAVPDLTTLAFGAGVLLIWAGLVESFISQRHQPQVPYGVKIAFGCAELILLALYLGYAGRASKNQVQRRERRA